MVVSLTGCGLERGRRKGEVLFWKGEVLFFSFRPEFKCYTGRTRAYLRIIILVPLWVSAARLVRL